jgi:predicted nuclease of predicted toxin-antitoxin system
MRLLLDMNMPLAAAEWLRSEGHDAVHLRELGLERLADREIVAYAGAEKRVLITCDLDFGDIVGSSTSGRSSVVLLRLRSLRHSRLRQRLRVALTQTGDALVQGAVVLVEESRIRVRSVPFANTPPRAP